MKSKKVSIQIFLPNGETYMQFNNPQSFRLGEGSSLQVIEKDVIYTISGLPYRIIETE
jgi:hypothetical protein